jgi:hypothetical protein
MNRDVFLSLLALDSYNRGYGEVVFTQPRGGGAVQNEAGRTIGNATIVDVPLPQGSLAVGFYAIAYDWNGETVISYRGTNFPERPTQSDRRQIGSSGHATGSRQLRHRPRASVRVGC